MLRNETICDQKVAIRTAAPADCTWDIGIIDAAQPSTKLKLKCLLRALFGRSGSGEC